MPAASCTFFCCVTSSSRRAFTHAMIRKARIMAWVKARRELDVTQQKKVQDAAGKRSR